MIRNLITCVAIGSLSSLFHRPFPLLSNGSTHRLVAVSLKNEQDSNHFQPS